MENERELKEIKAVYDHFMEVANGRPIKANVVALRVIMRYLNTINWGMWKLPQLDVGYTANQYMINGQTATTITLDEPIFTSEGRVRKFVVGAPRGHLNQYHNIMRLSDEYPN